MRALCGAVITAGAMIAVGLTALGIGTRYQGDRTHDLEGKPLPRVTLEQMDRSLVFALVFSTSVTVAGLGIAIAGLAYHHARREREYQWEKERHTAGQRTAV